MVSLLRFVLSRDANNNLVLMCVTDKSLEETKHNCDKRQAKDSFKAANVVTLYLEGTVLLN